MRVHELSRELGVPSRDILQSLEAMGYAGPVAMEAYASGDPEAAIAAFRDAFTV